VELWTKRCGEWRANSQLHSPDIAVARAYEIAASELGMALATAAAASPERGTGGEAKCQRCAGTGRLDGGWVRCDDCRGTGNALANATTGAVKP
jgi:RecJ-like exonuclease